MSRRPIFQDHHAIEQQTLDRSPLLKAISDAGHLVSMPLRTGSFSLPIQRLLRLWASHRIVAAPSRTTRMD